MLLLEERSPLPGRPPPGLRPPPLTPTPHLHPSLPPTLSPAKPALLPPSPAGSYAKQMGLPVERLIVATNSNDILHRYFSAGDYSSSGVAETVTPSMETLTLALTLTPP